MHIALIEPDIPQNTGTIARFCACMGAELHLIEPLGFIWSDHKLKRSGMDYLQHVSITRHLSWQHFKEFCAQKQWRLILSTTKAEHSFEKIEYTARDILLFGSETKGAADHIHREVDIRMTIPMQPHMRSLNLAVSVAMVSCLYKDRLQLWG